MGAEHLLADKGYDTEAIVAQAVEQKMSQVIPPKRACPEFCVNGADIKYRRGDLRTRW